MLELTTLVRKIGAKLEKLQAERNTLMPEDFEGRAQLSGEIEGLMYVLSEIHEIL